MTHSCSMYVNCLLTYLLCLSLNEDSGHRPIKRKKKRKDKKLKRCDKSHISPDHPCCATPSKFVTFGRVRWCQTTHVALPPAKLSRWVESGGVRWQTVLEAARSSCRPHRSSPRHHYWCCCRWCSGCFTRWGHEVFLTTTSEQSGSSPLTDSKSTCVVALTFQLFLICRSAQYYTGCITARDSILNV